MRKTLLVFIMLMASILSTKAQTAPDQLQKDLVALAKIYRNFHFSNSPNNEVFDQLANMKTAELQPSANFIAELIKSNNSIATKPFLTKPDSLTLKYLYVIRNLNWNLHESEPKDNKEVIAQLMAEQTSPQELLSCYYGMVFTSVGNKNRPLNMAGVNFTLDDYNLEDDTEKGIFFLESMNMFGTMIWGYMNVVKPPNYKAAMETIRNYPTYDGQAYYQYQDLNFPDFDLTLDKRKPKSSFKKYYLNKYMNTLLYHAQCAGQKKKDKAEASQIMLGSILKNESYYKFSENEEVLRKIFKKVSND